MKQMLGFVSQIKISYCVTSGKDYTKNEVD